MNKMFLAVVAAILVMPTPGVAQVGGNVSGPAKPNVTNATGTLPLANGGTGATTASAARTALGVPLGTSGATVPLLNGINSWSGGQTFQGAVDLNSAVPVMTFTGATAGSARGIKFYNSSNFGAEITFNYTTGHLVINSGEAVYSGDIDLCSGASCYANVNATGLHMLAGGVQLKVVAVASLPTCNAGAEGTRFGVSDANSTTFNATVAAGGANHIEAYCNGTGWTVH